MLFLKEVLKFIFEEFLEDSDDDEDGGVFIVYVLLIDEECLFMIIEGIIIVEFILVYCFVGEYFFSVGEYEIMVEFMWKVKEFFVKEWWKSGLLFFNIEDVYLLVLGIVFVYY